MTGIRFPRYAAAAAVVAVVTAMFGIGWLLGSGDGRSGAALGPSSAAPTSGTAASPSGAPASERPDGDDPQPGGPGGAGSEGGGGDGDSGEQRGPRISVFRVSQEPSCPGGTTQHPVDGTPVTLEWQVGGADEVTLSVDGSGVYNTYPAESSATISFPCSGQEGDTQEHTYQLTAVGDGVTRTGTLVVTATVHEVTSVPSGG